MTYNINHDYAGIKSHYQNILTCFESYTDTFEIFHFFKFFFCKCQQYFFHKLEILENLMQGSS